MSVIIRLQNLPWSANALDIRQYFHGLSIPEGGVHIVGGEQGDAFIAFSTDEDARQAFQRNNGKIKEVQINLLLSSRTEMQKVIEAARSIQTPFMQQVVAKPAIIPSIPTSLSNSDRKDESSTDSKSKDDKSKTSRSRRRSRTRSRDRDRKDRDRSRDRSRDRRDRRRRDRTRSRDRKRRDRKDRSKSRERTRSKERDNRRSRDKPRNVDRYDDNNSNHSNTNDSVKVNPWDTSMPRLTQNPPQNSPSLLGNFPGLINNNPLEEARRSLNILTGIQNQTQNTKPNVMNIDNGIMSNRNMIRNDWQINKPQEPSLGQMFQQLQRPMLTPKDFSNNQRPMFQNNLGSRPPFNQNFNRPFMNRPGMTDMLQTNRNSPDYTLKGNNFDPYKRKMNEETENVEGESCIQIRPYWGGYGDLRRFFQGLFISNTGIKVVREGKGKRNGIVYIKFVHPESRGLALRKNGMNLKGNNLEILPITNDVFDEYGGNENDLENQEIESPIKKQPFTCLIVEDIPSFAKEHDMLKMFSDYSLLGIDIQSENRRRHAYIQFNKEEDAQKALEETNKHILGGKQLVVRACPEKQIANPIQEENQDQPIEIDDEKDEMEIHEQENDNNFDTDVILLTGMPPKTSDRDVIDFFSDIGLIPTRIHMVMNKFGPSGECYCEFSSPDEAISALDKNGMPMGPANINVELFPREEMEKNLGMTPNFPPNQNHLQNRFAGRLGPRPFMHVRPPFMPNRMMGHPPINRHEGMIPLDPNMGPPGCVLCLENVPYKAGIDEILNFFHNFDVNHHSVMRRYNDNGTPTGDARVTFVSPSEAKRAFDECKYQKIRDRTIFLKLM